MFVDASAMVAILALETEAEDLSARLDGSSRPITSALAVYEAVTALTRIKDLRVEQARRLVRVFLERAGISTVEIGEAERENALDAFDRYGKGRHPARLNMGDCFAYACARTHGVPLLFKGDDFSQTDIAVA